MQEVLQLPIGTATNLDIERTGNQYIRKQIEECPNHTKQQINTNSANNSVSIDSSRAHHLSDGKVDR